MKNITSKSLLAIKELLNLVSTLPLELYLTYADKVYEMLVIFCSGKSLVTKFDTPWEYTLNQNIKKDKIMRHAYIFYIFYLCESLKYLSGNTSQYFVLSENLFFRKGAN